MNVKAVVSFVAVTLFAVSANAGDVKIKNNSDWSIQHLYISATDEEEWGPDQLGDDVIATGDSFILRNIPCDSYDVKLIDEDGDSCVVPQVDICGSGGWKIESEDLLACQADS